jgi:hypothetical protein
MLIRGSNAVESAIARNPVPTPAANTPPTKPPFLSKSMILETVPRSIAIQGQSQIDFAATAPQTKSAPSSAGLSIRMFNPVFSPGPTISAFILVRLLIAAKTLRVIGGTTLDIIAPVMEIKST